MIIYYYFPPFLREILRLTLGSNGVRENEIINTGRLLNQPARARHSVSSSSNIITKPKLAAR